MRSPTRTLFGKILFWTISAQLATAGTILALMTFYVPQTQEAVEQAFTLYAQTAVTLLERFGPGALDDFLARTGESTLLTLHLSSVNASRPCGPAVDARRSHAVGIAVTGTTGTYCLNVRAGLGGLPESPEARRTRLQIVVLLELICCIGLSFVIARHLSRPISDLRDAARRLAQGDLAARAGDRFAERSDEAALLVREFDHMADRISDLVQAQRRLIGDVSHEIKSPLARLALALGLARRTAESHAARHFARMQDEIDGISRLIGELLTLATLDAGAFRLKTDVVDMDALVAALRADAAYEHPERADDIAVAPSAGDAFVAGDAEMLGRAIGNVVRNAVFYTEPGTPIVIRCAHAPAGRLRVMVQDHGPGVPSHALEHLFAPFYRVDEARTRQTGGTGIGLTICRRTIELHGGEVAASANTTRGLRIVIDLPRLAPNHPRRSASTQLHTAPA